MKGSIKIIDIFYYIGISIAAAFIAMGCYIAYFFAVKLRREKPLGKAEKQDGEK